ncbi:DUF3365 domain-containing protein [Chryseobacterium sp.]|uniref:Tll0287-like domain-containing protein n=1 Tax=Chryseobacterium sp. TaxID=1871047 RepID=UPI002FC6A803
MNLRIATLLLSFIVASCKQATQNEKQISALKRQADSIATVSQMILLQNVAGAIQKEGIDYAVEFCNIQAMPLTDSIAEGLNVYIQRLSDKNRNPANAIKTQADSLAWKKIKSKKADFIEQHNNGEVYYYKPILIAMPTCVKCHGGKSDIAESTQNSITQKYPGDKAVNYKMGDLRGMWKIKLK